MPMLPSESTPIPDVRIIERAPFEDARGCFRKIWDEGTADSIEWGQKIAQINFSRTRGIATVRGLHFQLPPHSEVKIVTCLSGAVFDVAVDLRAGSGTFLKWQGEILSADNGKSLVIPKGFAHGFQVLVENSELLYLHSEGYHPASDRVICADDPLISVAWPHAIEGLSDRDRAAKRLSQDWLGIEL